MRSFKFENLEIYYSPKDAADHIYLFEVKLPDGSIVSDDELAKDFPELAQRVSAAVAADYAEYSVAQAEYWGEAF